MADQPAPVADARERIRDRLLAVRDACVPAFSPAADVATLVEALRAAGAAANSALATVSANGRAERARQALVRFAGEVPDEPTDPGEQLDRAKLIAAAARSLQPFIELLAGDGTLNELAHRRALAACWIAARLVAPHGIPELIAASENAESRTLISDPERWERDAAAMHTERRLLEAAAPFCAIARASADGQARTAANRTRPTSTHRRKS